MKSLILAAATMALVSFAQADGCMGDAAKSAACCASSEANAVGMVKGGAENTTTGYGLGQKVPDFTLPDAAGVTHSLSEFAGKPVAIVFYNQRCPFVKDAMPGLADYTKTYEAKGVKVLAIDAGVNNKPEEIAEHAKEKPYTILVDQDSTSARNFNATHTPQVFLLDKEGVVVYTGAFQVTEDDGTVTNYTQLATDAILAGKPVEKASTKAFGCTIKFKEADDKKM